MRYIFFGSRARAPWMETKSRKESSNGSISLSKMCIEGRRTCKTGPGRMSLCTFTIGFEDCSTHRWLHQAGDHPSSLSLANEEPTCCLVYARYSACDDREEEQGALGEGERRYRVILLATKKPFMVMHLRHLEGV